MISNKYNLWINTEYDYPVKGNFIPNIVSYIHEDDKLRPAMLVVPGGGYSMVFPTEGELVALEFYKKGYNTFVLTYTTNLLMTTPLKMQPLMDLSKAVIMVRKKAELFHIIPQKLSICGFSAGGHLCGSLAVHFNAEELILSGKYSGISNRPDAVILSYPVITAHKYAHSDSFKALLGSNASAQELHYMSLEKQVTKDTPPAFIWHTATDEVVPVENSYLFVEACKKQGVIFEHHVFGNGGHGMSLANDNWITGNYGGDYTLQQFVQTIPYLANNNIELPYQFNAFIQGLDETNINDSLIKGIKQFVSKSQSDEGIALWPTLADNWLKKVL